MHRIFGGLAIGTSRVGIYLGALLVGLMVLHIFAEVVSRAAFHRPLIGTIEIASYYYMIAVAFVPLGFAQDRHDHIEAEVFEAVIPHRLRKFTRMLGFLLSIGATGLLFYVSTTTALRMTRFGEAVMTMYGELPIWPARWLLPIGLGGMLLMMIHQLFFRGDLVAPDVDTAATPQNDSEEQK